MVEGCSHPSLSILGDSFGCHTLAALLARALCSDLPPLHLELASKERNQDQRTRTDEFNVCIFNRSAPAPEDSETRDEERVAKKCGVGRKEVKRPCEDEPKLNASLSISPLGGEPGGEPHHLDMNRDG